MVRRGGRDVIPVEVYKQNYDTLKEMALTKGMNAKGFVNYVLELYIKKEECLNEQLPGLSVEAAFGNRVVVKDLPKREFVDVYLNDFDLQCEKDKTNYCVHTKFLWLSPEIPSFFKRSEINGKAEEVATGKWSQQRQEGKKDETRNEQVKGEITLHGPGQGPNKWLVSW